MAMLRCLFLFTLLSILGVQAIDAGLGVKARDTSRLSKRKDTDPKLLYQAHNFSVPIDHFKNESRYEPHSNGTFPLRYWFDASYYEPGGPVIVLQSGETTGTNRLPYLQKGIVAQLAKATHGIGVILEHRYYGTSFPVEDLSTADFRFLSTEQALADEAYFASNIKFPGLEQHDLTAKTTAYISYGGSYAGAFSAFLRVQYPEIFWGSISSSGVTKAIVDYWEYFSPIAQHGPPACIATHRALTDFVDKILIGKDDTELPAKLKAVFGLQNVTHNDDFAQILADGIYAWQSLNWDPAVSDDEFYQYCDNITSSIVLYPNDEKASTLQDLVQEGGLSLNQTLFNNLLNMIGYYNLTAVQHCASKNRTQDHCFGDAHNETHNSLTSISEASWKSWPYQYCTEWGYFQTGNTPADEMPLVSRLLDVEYLSLVCRLAFNITEAPAVELVNKYGGYDISYPRLAIIDGDWDPWKPATPHAFECGAKNRTSTASEPFLLIPEAVHHWDENGLFENETTAALPPRTVADAQAQLVQSVQSWMMEWELHCLSGSPCSNLPAHSQDL